MPDDPGEPASTDLAAPGDPLAEERAQWVELVGDDAVLDGLVRRHRERHRRYHTLGHVLAVVRHVDELASVEAIGDLGAVVAAAWFHDAVYEPRSSANERASARLARRDLTKLGWAGERVESVATMVEGTTHHRDPDDLGTAVLYDADLAILGAAPDEYSAYVANVRAEYAHVDDVAWAAGRSDVLAAFIGRTRIFSTGTGYARWESSARTNVESEIAQLRR
ncbi:MAG: metal-dependent phosphohydrolase [Ilumatobacter sp.]|uniref:HD domain-containing protein n=1 Tax=Ilumatobacter sp. TaxID=1967498 RepID=UPI003296DBB5